MKRYKSRKRTNVSIRRPAAGNGLTSAGKIPAVDILISNKIKQFQGVINEAGESSSQGRINKQQQKAEINITNVIIVGRGEVFEGKLTMEGFCRQINLETDEQGCLQVNGQRMEGKEILDGIKVYVIR